MTHKLDKEKIYSILKERGWKHSPFGDWIVPLNSTNFSIEKDWTDAILEGVVCSLEEERKETREFLKKHPTPKR